VLAHRHGSGANQPGWSLRVFPNKFPVLGIEGDLDREGEGLFDKMQGIGAHEVIVENARHDRQLWTADDREIEQYLTLCALRIQDLKKDGRFKYVSVMKNFGLHSGGEFDHPTSEVVATTFVPRRVLYELRAAREHYKVKERCVFCDIFAQEQKQEKRLIEVRGDYLVSCPYASRTPYETWIAPRVHEAYFERVAAKSGALRDLAALLRRTLFRIRSISDGFHMVLHTSPNTLHKSETLGYWKTIDDDYHWHIEVLPILGPKAKSYTFKEVYASPVTPESAASRLRERPTD
jgi:UDPglucose--hexose-1-phosphate uridylyltransferase